MSGDKRCWFDVPRVSKVDEVPGLTLVLSAITPAQERAVMADINTTGTWDDTSLRRRVQHYGFRYAYDKPRLDVAEPIPPWAINLCEACKAVGLLCSPEPNQVIVNEYVPGQGITPHVDHEKLFGPYVMAVSLGSGCVMDFTCKETGKAHHVFLPPRSAYKMEGDARYLWTHGIAARVTDKVGSSRIERGTRVSVTYRCTRED